MCQVFGVSRSGYYNWVQHEPSDRKQSDERLKLEIKVAHIRTRETYGTRRLQTELAENGIIVGRDRLARLRKELRLRCKQKRKFRATTNSNHNLPVAPNLNRPGFPGECFICELRLPDHRFRWKHNKLFLLLPEEYGPAFPAIVDCYTSPPTLVWPVPLLHGFSSSYGVLPPLCKDH